MSGASFVRIGSGSYRTVMNTENKFNMSLTYTQIYQYCKTQPVHTFQGLKYVIIKQEDAEKLKISNKHAKISIKDPMVKNVKNLCVNDVIATYRDYELNVSPYYAFRIVTNTL